MSHKMELELGLKISKTIVDFTSSADLLFAKDRSIAVFVSKETESMFILTAHLKGYKREFIKIEINEDGTRIAVSCEKPVEEIVMVGWKVYKKETEMRGFKKAFKIPHGVILDKIKAKLDEEECILTISMPKSMKGMVGICVEEVKDDQGVEKWVGESSEKEEEGGSMEASQENTTGEEVENEERIESSMLKEVEDQDQEEKEEIQRKENGVEVKEEVEEVKDDQGVEKWVGESSEKEEEGGSMEASQENTTGEEVENEERIESSMLKEVEDQDQEEREEIQRKENGVEVKEEVLKQETKKRENEQVESGKLEEKGLEEHENIKETMESTKNVPHEVIQEKEIKKDKWDQELESFSRPKQVIEQDQEVRGKEETDQERESDIEEKEDDDEEEEKEKERGLVKGQEEAHRGEPLGREREKRSRLSVPIIAGSAFLVSIIVLVIQLIRTQNPQARKKN
ncbi:HSP20-like chaperone protein [Actinidia chinensis var. chinensis]|uniref:HSP20-like chaperone protein n=1 Tax=Actinidia chinensis var. chinensis TaxID=1590841 RepID=A0A2R6R2P0_ACTCC|nr:HSP20-like chaperone protein [Actinidia chinensis var. chinensis]